MMQVINSTMGSALPSNAIPFITAEWGITNEQQQVLPISVFLIGYVFGPVVWAPLSEHLGRRMLTIITFVMFTIWTMACALAPNWPAFLFFRLFTGVFASSPIAIVAGILADIYGDTETRGRAMTAFMVVSHPCDFSRFRSLEALLKTRRQPPSALSSPPSFLVSAPRQ